MNLQQAQEKIESLNWIMKENRPFNPNNWPIYRLIAAPSNLEALEKFYEQYIMSGPYSENWGDAYFHSKDREDFEVFVHFDNTHSPGHTGNNVDLIRWEDFLENNPEFNH